LTSTTTTRSDSPTVRQSDVLALLRLALPVVVVQVGIMFMGTVDTLMVGRVSPTALAAVAIGNLYSVIGIFFGQGVLLALDPLINQAHGAGDRPGVVRAFQRALLLSLILAIPITLYHLVADPILTAFRPPMTGGWCPGCCRSSPSGCCAGRCRPFIACVPSW
jgi:MATE family multidrug resistance protein